MFNHAIALLMAMHASEKSEEKGATAVEYALVVGLVSLVVVAAVAGFGPKITDFISNLSFR